MRASLGSVIDLRDPDIFARVGLQSQSLSDTDWSRCQLVGGATEFLGHDGLLIPSARAQATNLVIFPNRRDPEEELEIVDKESISEWLEPR